MGNSRDSTRYPVSRFTTDEVLAILWSTTEWYDEDYREEGFADWSVKDFLGNDLDLTFPRKRAFIQWSAQWEHIFDIEVTAAEWSFMYDANVTVRDLARFITQRARRRSVQPLRLLGRACVSSGIFRHLAALARSCPGVRGRIRPSTSMSDVMDDDLLQLFYARLFPYVENLQAVMKRGWVGSSLAWLRMIILCTTALVTFVVLFAIACCWGLLSSRLGTEGAAMGVVFFMAVAFTLIAILGNLLDHKLCCPVNPLGDQARTFRDLVRLLEPNWRRCQDTVVSLSY